MINDFNGKAVLITGGTMGIGLATGLAFGKNGAQVYLTYAWGSADEDEIRQKFCEAGAPEPVMVQADVSRDDDTVALMERIAQDHDGVEVFISNVSVVPTAHGLQSYSKRAMFKSLEFCTWPLVAYLQQIHKTFDRYPRYVIGVSTDGMDLHLEGYEYVAVSKALMEVLCRYLVKHLQGEDIRINCIRTRNVETESALEMHGRDYPRFIKKYASANHFLQPDEVGNVMLAICSGMLDALSGQVINVDRGGPFSDTLMRLYRHREEYGL